MLLTSKYLHLVKRKKGRRSSAMHTFIAKITFCINSRTRMSWSILNQKMAPPTATLPDTWCKTKEATLKIKLVLEQVGLTI
jgi:hypothetical protein